MSEPAEPKGHVVAFVDEYFWYPCDDGRWEAWDVQDVGVDGWSELVALAHEKDQRDPVVYRAVDS